MANKSVVHVKTPDNTRSLNDMHELVLVAQVPVNDLEVQPIIDKCPTFPDYVRNMERGRNSLSRAHGVTKTRLGHCSTMASVRHGDINFHMGYHSRRFKKKKTKLQQFKKSRNSFRGPRSLGSRHPPWACRSYRLPALFEISIIAYGFGRFVIMDSLCLSLPSLSITHASIRFSDVITLLEKSKHVAFSSVVSQRNVNAIIRHCRKLRFLTWNAEFWCGGL